jgi:CRP/FNR family transcriptional regulator
MFDLRYKHASLITNGSPIGAAFDGQPSENFSADQTIFCEGDDAVDIFSLTYGQLRLYKTLRDGRRAITGFSFPGEFLGVSFYGKFLVSAESVTDIKMKRLSRRKFQDIATSSSLFQSEISALVSRELRNAEEHILLLARLTAEERVARFLLDVYRRSGRCEEITLPMNRIDIADYLGLTVETISRMASSLARKNLIISRNFGHVVKIVDVKGLSKIAQIDVQSAERN